MSANNLVYSPEDENDPRSIIEIIVARLGGTIRAYEKHYGSFYCIADWVYNITGSKDKDRYKAWNDLKFLMSSQHALEVSKIHLEKGKFPSSKGTTIELDATDSTGLLYIFQFIYQAEPNDTIIAVRRYLAMAGYALDVMRQDPESAIDFAIDRYKALGKTPEWIQVRLQGKIVRKQFTTALEYALISIQNWHYGAATNTIYVGLWGRVADVLKDQLRLKKGNIRDNLSIIALSYLTIAESLSADKLGNKTELAFDEADDIIRKIALAIGEQVKMTEKISGRDMILGDEKLPENHPYHEQIEEQDMRTIGSNGKFIN